MLKSLNNKILISILIISSFIIISAYTIEHGMGYKACKLCIYERLPYIVSIPLIIYMLFFANYKKEILLILVVIFSLGSLLSFYHFGIEQGFFTESFACKHLNLEEVSSKEQLLEELKKNTMVSCKDVSFKIFGLSLAAINTIFSIVLSAIFVKLFISYEKN